jgi:hypothetical protein
MGVTIAQLRKLCVNLRRKDGQTVYEATGHNKKTGIAVCLYAKRRGLVLLKQDNHVTTVHGTSNITLWMKAHYTIAALSYYCPLRPIRGPK